jgi:hypothetical protein
MKEFPTPDFERGPKVELIEEADIPVGKKLDLALLILDRKEATQLGNFHIPESDTDRKNTFVEFNAEYQSILTLLQQLSLKYKVRQEPKEDDDIIGFSVLVSRDEQKLERFIEADESGDDRTFGLLVGYPESAINAYQTEDAFDWSDELPAKTVASLQEEHIEPFLHFMPSRSHWAEELDFARHNRDLVRDNAPKLYQELSRE